MDGKQKRKLTIMLEKKLKAMYGRDFSEMEYEIDGEQENRAFVTIRYCVADTIYQCYATCEMDKAKTTITGFDVLGTQIKMF